jgi:hypothetical protein
LPCLLVRLVAVGGSGQAFDDQVADAGAAFAGEAFGALQQGFGDAQGQVLGVHDLSLAHLHINTCDF